MNKQNAYLDLERCVPTEDGKKVQCHFVWRYEDDTDAQQLLDSCEN